MPIRDLSSPPGTPAGLRGRLVEIARREWALPTEFSFEELESFLNRHGVLPGSSGTAAVGAGLLLSGDIRVGRQQIDPQASPAPAVPAACAVVFAAGQPQPDPVGTARIGAWASSWNTTAHMAAVTAVRTAIAAGDVYQVNIVGHRSAPCDGDPQAVGRALATIADAPYAGGLSGDGWSVFSASPECLLEVSKGVATTRPIKGTTAVDADGAANERARAALAASSKDHAEHVMIVDLVRNDLGRVAAVGGVAVTELYDIRTLAGVWHAESTVTARLADGVVLTDLLSAVFPGGSVTGAPKLAALDLIARLEPVGRGPAMGALGWIGSDGEIRLGLTIRTMAVEPGRVHLWTGGGVTWGSDPRAEVAEADVKAAPLLAALAALHP